MRIENLINLRKKFKRKKLKVGLVHGVFDVLHSGHIDHLREAKIHCDKLIVTVTSDKYVNKGPNRPLFKCNKRISNLLSIRSVDYALESNNPTPIEIIKKIKPDVYIKGSDYKNPNLDLTNNLSREIRAIKIVGGKFISTKTKNLSSTKIINNDLGAISPEIKKILNNCDLNKMNKFLKDFTKKRLKKKILIFGEHIIDKYTYVDPIGKSVKNNIVTLNYKNDEIFSGGSLMVANLLSKFVDGVSIVVFENKYNKKYYNKLLSKNVKLVRFKDEEGKVIIKNRFVDKYSNRVLSQVNYNDQVYLSANTRKKLYKYIKNNSKKNDINLLYDFGHGLINNNDAKNNAFHKKNTFINCQSNSSNFGFNKATKFTNFNTICMDNIEFRLCAQNKIDPLDKIIKKNEKFISSFKNFIITNGKEGCYFLKRNKKTFIPSITTDIVDTTGCGDVFFAILTLMLSEQKFNENEISLTSHAAAGLHSKKIGNYDVVSPMSLYRAVEHLFKS